MSGANSFVAGIIDIEALRQFRTMNLNSNWMKDLRTEIFRRMYEEPVHPTNLWLDEEPLRHADVDEIYRANIGGWWPAAASPRRRIRSPAHSTSHPGSRATRTTGSRCAACGPRTNELMPPGR